MKKTFFVLLTVALVLAAVILLAAPVADALGSVNDLWEVLFPSGFATVTLEGQTETVPYEAGGQLPDAAPGFVIYYDTDRYTMTEESGVTYIRFVTDAQIPPCEVEIRHVPGILPDAAAADIRAQQLPLWETASGIEASTQPEGLCFVLSSGMEWDSPREEVYCVSDGSRGTFRIHVRYFLEASEGHGTRFRQMLQTFSVLPAGQ